MPKGERLEVDGVDVVAQVHAVLDRMAAFAARVRGGQWTGHSGKRIRNVVRIGIGGSDLGPVMACEALRDFSDSDMRIAFVSNVDGTDLSEAVSGLAPAETRCLACPHTSTNLETLAHAQAPDHRPR